MAQPGTLGRQGSSPPSLPPLTQPTGELPKVRFGYEPPEETVVVSSGLRSEGVFADRETDRETDRELDRGTGLSRFGSPMPSALSAADDPFAIASAPTGVMPALGSNDGVFGNVTDEVDEGIASVESQLAAARSAHAATNPFPESGSDGYDAAYGFDGDADATTVASYGDLTDREGSGRPLAMGVSAAAARQATGRGGGSSSLDAPTDIGPAARNPGGYDRPDSAGTDRLQDTEFKLADRRRKQKPKEPNRLVLGLALGLVILAGIGVAWLLTRSGGSDGTETADADLVANPDAASDETAAETTLPPNPEPQVDGPTLFFDEAQTGPLEQGKTYSIDLVGEPEGALLQVVVDDIAQGTPDLQLPDLILPAGRHSLFIQITSGADVTPSTPVEVYVLGDPPPRGFRANLSSVDIQNEGWVEAVRQFDEYRAAGHEGLQLAPLSDGYWNIFIGGLGEDRAAAQAYCESFGLAVPDQCFPTYFDGAPASTPTETTVAESMTDDGASTSTSAAGG